MIHRSAREFPLNSKLQATIPPCRGVPRGTRATCRQACASCAGCWCWMPDRSRETEARSYPACSLKGVASARDCESRCTELGERHIQANSPRSQALATRKPDSYICLPSYIPIYLLPIPLASIAAHRTAVPSPRYPCGIFLAMPRLSRRARSALEVLKLALPAREHPDASGPSRPRQVAPSRGGRRAQEVRESIGGRRKRGGS